MSVLQECPTRVSYKSVPQECPTRVSYKSVQQECPTRVSFGHISFSNVFAFGFVGSILFFWGGEFEKRDIFKRGVEGGRVRERRGLTDYQGNWDEAVQLPVSCRVIGKFELGL